MRFGLRHVFVTNNAQTTFVHSFTRVVPVSVNIFILIKTIRPACRAGYMFCAALSSPYFNIVLLDTSHTNYLRSQGVLDGSSPNFQDFYDNRWSIWFSFSDRSITLSSCHDKFITDFWGRIGVKINRGLWLNPTGKQWTPLQTHYKKAGWVWFQPPFGLVPAPYVQLF